MTEIGMSRRGIVPVVAAVAAGGLFGLLQATPASAALPAECDGSGPQIVCTYTPLAPDPEADYVSVPFVVPSWVTSATFDLRGGAGGSGYLYATAPGQNPVFDFNTGGGRGGTANAVLPLTPGETLRLFVGGQGESGQESGLAAEGGVNGGGAGGALVGQDAAYDIRVGGGGGGGGSFVVRPGQGGSTPGNGAAVVLAAGGGGGAAALARVIAEQESPTYSAGGGGLGGGLSGGNGEVLPLDPFECSMAPAAGGTGLIGSYGRQPLQGASDFAATQQPVAALAAAAGGGGGGYRAGESGVVDIAVDASGACATSGAGGAGRAPLNVAATFGEATDWLPGQIRVTFAKEPAAVPTCQGVAATIVGTAGNDVLRGTSGRDVIVGLGGNDRILGKGGDDLICGGDGNDRIRGNAGKDRLFGDAGNDRITGDGGRDYVNGGDGNDALSGEGGADKLYGQNGQDILRGGGGDDLLNGGANNDAGSGGRGNNTLESIEVRFS